MDLPFVSIVIVSYNRREDLSVCLQSVQGIDYPEFEVLVLDNASTDSSADMVARDFPEVRLYRGKENSGLCVARNFGAMESRGSYLWFLDNDTEITDPGILRQYVSLMEGDTSVGIVGGEAVLNDQGRIIGTKRLHVRRNGMIQGEAMLDLGMGETAEADCIQGANLFLRRQLFLDTGGFDLAYYIYFEDIDFSLRVRKKGLRLVVMGQIPVIHHFSAVSRVSNLPLMARNRFYFVLKNLPVSSIVLLPLNDLLFLLNPSNAVRLKRRAAIIDLGAKGFAHHASVSRIGIRKTLRVLVSASVYIGNMLAGYIFVWPVILAALRARRSERDNFGKSVSARFSSGSSFQGAE